MGTTLATIVALVLASILTLIDKYFHDDIKKSKFVQLRSLPLILIIITLTFSIINEFLRHDEEINAKNDRETEYKNTIKSLKGILKTGNESLNKIDNLKKDATELNKIFSEDVFIQKEINKASKELLYKNREMYNKTLEDEILKSKKYEKEIKNCFVSITRLYNVLEFELHNISIDSSVKLKKLYEVNLKLSNLLNSIEYNPILIENPIINKYWNSLDSVIEKLNFPLSGYDTISINEIVDNLSLHVRRFIGNINLYEISNNGSFRYPPFDLSILKQFD